MNNKNKNSIDQLFSEKLQNHTAKPRDLVWENLDKALAKKNGKSYTQYWALAAFLVFALGGTSLFFWNSSEEENLVIEQRVEKEMPLEVQKPKSNSEEKNTVEAIIIDEKEDDEIQQQNLVIAESAIQKKIKKMNPLSAKKEENKVKTSLNQEKKTISTTKKEEVATLQESKTAGKVSANGENADVQVSEISEKEEQTSTQKENLESVEVEVEVEQKEEVAVVLEEKQETKKAGVHLTIRLGTQAGGRDEGREELEAEERANKKTNLIGKVLKGAWKLKKEKELTRKK